MNNEQKDIGDLTQVREKLTAFRFKFLYLRLYQMQIDRDIDSFLNVYMSKYAKRLDCRLPGTVATRPMNCKEWYLFLNPNREVEIFYSNVKKLCYIFEHKMKDDILWESFVGYVLMKRGAWLTSGYIPEGIETTNNKSVRELFKDRVQRRRKRVRDGCRRRSGYHVSNLNNAAGGKGKKNPLTELTPTEINRARYNRRLNKKKSGGRLFYLYSMDPVKKEKSVLGLDYGDDSEWDSWESGFQKNFFGDKDILQEITMENRKNETVQETVMAACFHNEQFYPCAEQEIGNVSMTEPTDEINVPMTEPTDEIPYNNVAHPYDTIDLNQTLEIHSDSVIPEMIDLNEESADSNYSLVKYKRTEQTHYNNDKDDKDTTAEDMIAHDHKGKHSNLLISQSDETKELESVKTKRKRKKISAVPITTHEGQKGEREVSAELVEPYIFIVVK